MYNFMQYLHLHVQLGCLCEYVASLPMQITLGQIGSQKLIIFIHHFIGYY
jgi:hypothetical protein